MVTIEYVELDAFAMDTGVEPDDEFLRNRFEQQKGRFVSPEQRRVSHILIEAAANADEATIETARQEALDLSERARAGESFEDLAREYSDDIGSAALVPVVVGGHPSLFGVDDYHELVATRYHVRYIRGCDVRAFTGKPHLRSGANLVRLARDLPP